MQSVGARRIGLLDDWAPEPISFDAESGAEVGPPSIAAVVVTYEPDLDRLQAVLDSAAREADLVVVVDNASSNIERLRALVAARDTITLVELEENQGIAAGLNTGVSAALTREPDFILTLDQDSVVHAGALRTVLDELALLPPDVQHRCGIVSLPSRLEPKERLRRPRLIPTWLLRRWRAAAGNRTMSQVGPFAEQQSVISSGSLIRADVAGAHRYEEAFFMDQVDTAFCLALRRAGLATLEYRSAILLDHRLGTEVATGTGPVVYEPGFRIYYLVRNSTVLWRRRWLADELYLLQVVRLSRAFLLVNGIAAGPRLGAILVLGVFDALTGRMGQRCYAVAGEPRRSRRRAAMCQHREGSPPHPGPGGQGR
jgi:rhamnosyltransferase